MGKKELEKIKLIAAFNSGVELCHRAASQMDEATYSTFMGNVLSEFTEIATGNRTMVPPHDDYMDAWLDSEEMYRFLCDQWLDMIKK